MKWSRIVYYIIISLIMVFFIIGCTAYPYLLLFTIPAGVFLYVFPIINKPNKIINALELENKQKLDALTAEIQRRTDDYEQEITAIHARASAAEISAAERAKALNARIIEENKQKVDALTAEIQRQSSAFAQERESLSARISAAEASAEEISRERNRQLITENENLNAELTRIKSISNAQSKLLSEIVPEMSGVMYERYVGSRLAIMGYTEIDYTPASGDFGADILAIAPDGSKTCIQCKRYESVVGLDAVQQVLGGKAYYKCDKAIVITNSIFTPQAKQLANNTDVELWENFV